MSTSVPAPPPVAPVQNPATAPRQSFLRGLLDPSSTTYLGNRYRPDLQAAGRDLRAGLEGFGDYSFAESPDGMLTATKQQSGQPGRLYKDAYFDARAAAAARGMLYSRTAESAVGDAWHRLTEQERAIHNQYAATTSGILSRQADEFTSVVTELYGLYGQDVQYALDNPILPADPAPATDTPAADAPASTASRRWVGLIAPDRKHLSRVWGIPVSQIRVTHAGDGRIVAQPR